VASIGRSDGEEITGAGNLTWCGGVCCVVKHGTNVDCWMQTLNKTLPVFLYYQCNILPLFQNIRCFSFVKQMYLDIF
jgi:hypothetical protein